MADVSSFTGLSKNTEIGKIIIAIIAQLLPLAKHIGFFSDALLSSLHIILNRILDKSKSIPFPF